jgi:hypothetical protein
MSSNAQAQGLSAAISSFQICNRTWKIGDTMHSIGTKAIEKKEKWLKLSAHNMRQEGLKESLWEEGLVRNIV